MIEIFTDIYKGNLWSGDESRSGTGSDLSQTNMVRTSLPDMLPDLGVRSMLDIPCGDMNWMSHILPILADNGIKYIGADLVPEVIKDIAVRFFVPSDVEFKVLDITKDELPTVDLIFVRDCLGHLSHEHVKMAVENIVRAEPKYLIATHWPGVVGGPDIRDGGWRPINMSPYLDEEIFTMIGYINEDIEDKKLGIWQLNQNSNQPS